MAVHTRVEVAEWMAAEEFFRDAPEDRFQPNPPAFSYHHGLNHHARRPKAKHNSGCVTETYLCGLAAPSGIAQSLEIAGKRDLFQLRQLIGLTPSPTPVSCLTRQNVAR